MRAKTTRGLSEAERAESRAGDREQLQQAAQELLTSDGWQRWVRPVAPMPLRRRENCEEPDERGSSSVADSQTIRCPVRLRADRAAV